MYGRFETLNLVLDAQLPALALGNLTVVSRGGYHKRMKLLLKSAMLFLE
jgi:hypothetical protein